MHKKYINAFYFISNLNEQNVQNLNKNISIIFRNYIQKPNINKLIKFRNLCLSQGRKFYLSNDPKLAYKLNLDGAYIPAFNKKMNLISRNLRKKFQIIGSAHNLKEIRIKELQGCKFIFISPLFKVNKTKKFLGIYRYNQLANLTNNETVALGGINYKNFKKLKMLKSIFFASISFIKKNGPKKIRPFNNF
jgi:thiamine-phosphate pyrophosphorylase